MKKFIKTFRKTIIFFIKLLLYVSLFLVFFLIMGLENPPLLRPSRTAAVTLSTFVIIALLLTAIYGKFDIGVRKSKPIIASMSLNVVITDLVTYLMLVIMKTTDSNNRQFRPVDNILLLIVVIIIQILLIYFFTYMGNYVYFRMYPAERCCIVTDSKESLNEIAIAVGTYKKQYKIVSARDYRSEKLRESLLQCDTVFIYNVPVKERTEIMEFCYRYMRNVYISPEISDIAEISSKHVILDDVSLIYAPVKELSIEQRIIKRTMDIVISALAIVITSPIMLICAIAIKANDGGKIIFKQRRATKNGHVFEVYKFRTMKENVKNYSAVSDDDRITSVGKVLRKYRLDELPQLFNILKGEMSLVGPRPEMLENVYMYTKEYPEFTYRLRVKAGLTGYAQIAGKYNTSPKHKLILDLIYIEQYSVLKDFKLLFQTLIVLFKPDSTEAFAKKQVKVLKDLDADSNDWWEDEPDSRKDAKK